MLGLGAVDSYSYGEMCFVFPYEPLHCRLMVIDAVCRETESIGIEPRMVQEEELLLDVVTDLINQFYLKEGLPADEVEHHRLLVELFTVCQYVVHGCLCYIERHPLLGVFSDQITVFTGQLTIFGDDEGNVLGHSTAPGPVSLLYFHKRLTT